MWRSTAWVLLLCLFSEVYPEAFTCAELQDEYRQRILEVYTDASSVKNRAKKIRNIDKVLLDNRGKEHKIYLEICTKYDAEPLPKLEAVADPRVVEEYSKLIRNVYLQPSVGGGKPESTRRLMKKYVCREHELYLKVCEKYGIEPQPEFVPGKGGHEREGFRFNFGDDDDDNSGATGILLLAMCLGLMWMAGSCGCIALLFGLLWALFAIGWNRVKQLLVCVGVYALYQCCYKKKDDPVEPNPGPQADGLPQRRRQPAPPPANLPKNVKKRSAKKSSKNKKSSKKK